MKKIIVSAILLIATNSILDAQQSGFHLEKSYVYFVRIDNYPPGYLVSMNDSSLQLSSDAQPFGNNTGKLYKYTDIESIAIRRNDSPGKSALWGAVTGAVLGSVIGLLTYHKPNPGDMIDFGPGASALVGGVGGTALGALFGAAAGSINYRVSIARQKQAFKLLYTDLLKD